MTHRKILGLLAASAATFLIATPAQAAPSAKDARDANAHADRSVQRSLNAARTGDSGVAVSRLAKARRLRTQAARITQRVAAERSPTAAARLLRSTATGVDAGFDSYAELLPEVPAELQPYVLENLEQFEAIRAELVGQLTGLTESLPPDLREQILATIVSLSADGDLQALIAALSDPALSAAIQEQLQALVAELTASVGEQIEGLEALEALLPPGGFEALEAAMAQIQAQLEEALAGAEPGTPLLPADICVELEALSEVLAIPLPSGLCPA